MDTQFYPEKDILINYRKNSVAGYMAPALQKASPHFHYQYELLLCAAGEADFMIGEHVYHIVPGSMLFMSNLENHAIVSYTKDYDGAFGQILFIGGTPGAIELQPIIQTPRFHGQHTAGMVEHHPQLWATLEQTGVCQA